tara:strand:+ start:6220 stop:6441 length:222 start_codon:yes stop_codon:yes gene_type:complete
MISSNEPANDTTKALLTVQEVAAKLHGPEYTETDINRLYRMIKSKQITSTPMGQRYFIPTWQVEKLVRGETGD